MSGDDALLWVVGVVLLAVGEWWFEICMVVAVGGTGGWWY